MDAKGAAARRDFDTYNLSCVHQSLDYRTPDKVYFAAQNCTVASVFRKAGASKSSGGPKASLRPLPASPASPHFVANVTRLTLCYAIRLEFDQPIGIDEPLDLDKGRGGSNRGKEFTMSASRSLPLGNIGQHDTCPNYGIERQSGLNNGLCNDL